MELHKHNYDPLSEAASSKKEIVITAYASLAGFYMRVRGTLP